MEDRHKGIKRWERAKQFAGLASEPEKMAPLAWCRVKGLEQKDKSLAAEGISGQGQVDEKIRVYILQIYSKDLTYVHVHGYTPPPGLSNPSWLVRGGIDWKEYLPEVVKHYRLGLAVPETFRPLRKLNPEILDHLERLPSRDLPLVFAKLRETRFLCPLPILERKTCPIGFTWDALRASFQDFLEKRPAMDSLPP